jgi:hypothetical protein
VHHPARHEQLWRVKLLLLLLLLPMVAAVESLMPNAWVCTCSPLSPEQTRPIGHEQMHRTRRRQ